MKQWQIEELADKWIDGAGSVGDMLTIHVARVAAGYIRGGKSKYGHWTRRTALAAMKSW